MDNIILPSPHGLLTSGQKEFLKIFFQLPDSEQFNLTGGTALAEYYLGHRLSYDLDLFTGVDGLVQPISFQIETFALKNGLSLQVIRRLTTFTEFLVTHEEETLKIDLALDSPFRFDAPIICDPGIRVNNFTDLCVDKLLAFYGRAEPRDAVDLFFILQYISPDTLLTKAAQKDTGFDPYWFAIALNRCLDFPDEAERWPIKMLVDWSPKNIKDLFQTWAMRLMGGLR